MSGRWEGATGTDEFRNAVKVRVHERIQLDVLLLHMGIDVAFARRHLAAHGTAWGEQGDLVRAKAERDGGRALVLLHLLAPEGDGLEARDGGRRGGGLVQTDRLLHVLDQLLLEVAEARLLLAEERLELLLVARRELLDLVELSAHDGPALQVLALYALRDSGCEGESRGRRRDACGWRGRPGGGLRDWDAQCAMHGSAAAATQLLTW